MPTETPTRELSDEERVAVDTLKWVCEDLNAPSADRVAAAQLLLRYEGRI